MLENTFFENNWPLTHVRMGKVLKDIEDGRKIGLLHAAEGDFVYRIADPSKTRGSLDRDLTAFAFLPAHGFDAVTKLVKTKSGALYLENNGRHFYVMEYVEGDHPPPTPQTYATLGALTAKLHGVAGYPYNTDFDADTIAANDLAHRGQGRTFERDFMRIVHGLPKFNHMPKALIHTDIGPQNSIQKPNGHILFIDWDDVGNGPALLDIGFPLFQQFVTEDCVFLPEQAKAFYAAYFAGRSMSAAEKALIFDAGLMIALDYIIYGDTEKRWKRILWALENRKLLESVFI